jgi:hypothetical protein
LPKGRAVQAKEFTDAALGIFNAVVDLVGREVDEAGGDLRKQRFEPQPVFEALMRQGSSP